MRLLLAALACFARGRHEPKRQALSGFRCLDCEKPGESLDEMGFTGGGYVPVLRKLYSRDNGGTLVRTDAWTPTQSGRGW